MSAVPLLVAVTRAETLARPDFAERLAAILDAGCPAVLVRGPGADAAALLAAARLARAACDARGAELWVGGRAETARLAGADRLHLPEQGPAIAEARKLLAPGTRVGRSIHSVDAARAAAAEGADHVVAGTIFASPSHPDAAPAGLALLAAIRAAGIDLPLVAIGGIDAANVAAARAAGADGVAAISALWDAPDPGAATAAILAAARGGATFAGPAR